MDSVKMRTLVVAGRRRTRQSALKLLDEDPDVESIGSCRSEAEAVAAIEARTPDLVLLEVAGSGIDGFQVLERVDPVPPVIVVSDSAAEAKRCHPPREATHLVSFSS